jgi:hypothetical protein
VLLDCFGWMLTSLVANGVVVSLAWEDRVL